MSDDEPKDESTDESEQQSDEQPADSDQPSAQSDDASADSDQPADQSDEQPAEEADQPEQQAEDQTAESDQPAEQTEEQPADSDQPTEQTEEQPGEGDQASAQAEEQPADSDQPTTSGSADDTVAFAGGDTSRGGGGGAGRSGPGKTSKVQVTAIFMTDSASSRFRGGSITMNVFDGAKGVLLWKLGSMDQQKVTFQDAATKSNVINSGAFSGVTGDSVKVELKVKMLGAESELDPKSEVNLNGYSEVNFGTAARFEVPKDNTLKVVADVETTSKEFTVNAKDEDSARDAAFKMLTSIEERHLARVDSAVDVGAGRFTVVFRSPTKRIRILQPKALEVIY